jgi:hypothetical protein
MFSVTNRGAIGAEKYLERRIGHENNMMPDRDSRIIRFLLKVLPTLICGTLAVTTNAEDAFITSGVRGIRRTKINGCQMVEILKYRAKCPK